MLAQISDDLSLTGHVTLTVSNVPFGDLKLGFSRSHARRLLRTAYVSKHVD